MLLCTSTSVVMCCHLQSHKNMTGAKAILCHRLIGGRGKKGAISNWPVPKYVAPLHSLRPNMFCATMRSQTPHAYDLLLHSPLTASGNRIIHSKVSLGTPEDTHCAT